MSWRVVRPATPVELVEQALSEMTRYPYYGLTRLQAREAAEAFLKTPTGEGIAIRLAATIGNLDNVREGLKTPAKGRK